MTTSTSNNQHILDSDLLKLWEAYELTAEAYELIRPVIQDGADRALLLKTIDRLQGALSRLIYLERKSLGCGPDGDHA